MCMSNLLSALIKGLWQVFTAATAIICCGNQTYVTQLHSCAAAACLAHQCLLKLQDLQYVGLCSDSMQSIMSSRKGPQSA